MKPKVTIIIPCYNAEKYIEKCIRSAMSQTYENVEVIFIDNDSADDSLEINSAPLAVFPWTLYPPSFALVWGVNPRWL